DTGFSAFRAFKVGIASKHLEQYLSLDCALRRKLHPQNSQYLASRIIAPTGTRWVSYSPSPCQRACGSIQPGAAKVCGRSLNSAHSRTRILGLFSHQTMSFMDIPE